MNCETCKNKCNCKERVAYEALSKIGNAECSGYEPNDMPNKNLTDAEVKKALECCSKYNTHDGCPLRDDTKCLETLPLNALDLINRQEADIKQYKELLDIAKIKFKKDEAEIKRLENRNIKNCRNWQMKYNSLKAEAYKECIEKVKEKSCELNMCHNDVVVKTDYQISGESLNNLLNELVGDANETR